MNPDRFVFIIGAMKSGTTSLFDILGQHPEICPARKKEPSFFAADRDSKSLDEYLGLWDWNAGEHKYAIESSVTYTQMPFIKGVPARMSQADLGEYRFIYLMRDPLTRIESHARHALFAGWGKSLDAGIGNDIVNVSRYTMQLDEYLKYFPKENILPIVLEEFKESPNQVLERICGFLEIEKHYNFVNVSEPRNTGDFFDSPPLIRRISQSRLGKLIVRKILPFQFKSWLRKKITYAGKISKKKDITGRWRLTDNEKKDIYTALLPDLERLQSEYAIDVFKYWKTPASIDMDL